MIYWQGINIGDWRFYAEIVNIKSAILFQSEHAQWHVAQNFPQTNSPNITLANKSSCTVHVYTGMYIQVHVLYIIASKLGERGKESDVSTSFSE